VSCGWRNQRVALKVSPVVLSLWSSVPTVVQAFFLLPQPVP
jgi:hypothetical protein